MPGEFLPLIEHEDVIVGIGDWVIAEALRQQPARRGHDLTISVNIAARQLVRRQFAERLEAIVGEGMPAPWPAGDRDPRKRRARGHRHGQQPDCQLPEARHPLRPR
jgi:hypothetical protein